MVWRIVWVCRWQDPTKQRRKKTNQANNSEKMPQTTQTVAAESQRGPHRRIWMLIRWLIQEDTVISHLLEQVWTYSAEYPRNWMVLIETWWIFLKNTRMSRETTWRLLKILKKFSIILEISGDHVCVVCEDWSDDQGWATKIMRLSQNVDAAEIALNRCRICLLHERELFLSIPWLLWKKETRCSWTWLWYHDRITITEKRFRILLRLY